MRYKNKKMKKVDICLSLICVSVVFIALSAISYMVGSQRGRENGYNKGVEDTIYLYEEVYPYEYFLLYEEFENVAIIN